MDGGVSEERKGEVLRVVRRKRGGMIVACFREPVRGGEASRVRGFREGMSGRGAKGFATGRGVAMTRGGRRRRGGEALGARGKAGNLPGGCGA